MLDYFKKTTFMAVIMGLGIFIFNILITLLDILMAMISTARSGGFVKDSNDGGPIGHLLISKSVGDLVAAIAFLVLLILAVKLFGSRFMQTKGFFDTMKKGMSMPGRSLKSSVRNSADFMRGLRNLDGNTLRRAARNNMLFGGKNGRRFARAANAKENIQMLKDITKKGADGRIAKQEKKALEKGTPGKNNVLDANDFIKKRNEAELNALGLDKNNFSRLGKDEQAKVLGIMDDKDKTRGEKIAAISDIQKGQVAEDLARQGKQFGFQDVSNEEYRRRMAALSHGQELDEFIRKNAVYYETTGEKMLDADGNVVGVTDYIKGKDDRAASVAERFVNTHPELISSHRSGFIPGSDMMKYALFIHRSQEDMNNAAVGGSTTNNAALPHSNSDDAATTTAADATNMPIDRDVADSQAAKSKQRMDANAESPEGMPSDNQPVDDSQKARVHRDEKGYAQPDFADDEISRSGEALSGGNPSRGTVASEEMTDREYMPTMDDIRENTQEKAAQYASGVGNADFREQLQDGMNLGAATGGEVHQQAQAAAQTADAADNFGDGTQGMPSTVENVYGAHREQQQTPQEVQGQPVSSTPVNDYGYKQQDMPTPVSSFRDASLTPEQNQQFTHALSNIMSNNANGDMMGAALSSALGGMMGAHVINALGRDNDIHGRELKLSDEAVRQISDLTHQGLRDMSQRVDALDRNSKYTNQYVRDIANTMMNDMSKQSAENRDFFAQNKDAVREDIENTLGDAMRDAAHKQAEQDEARRKERGTRGLQDGGHSGRL